MGPIDELARTKKKLEAAVRAARRWRREAESWKASYAEDCGDTARRLHHIRPFFHLPAWTQRYVDGCFEHYDELLKACKALYEDWPEAGDDQLFTAIDLDYCSGWWLVATEPDDGPGGSIFTPSVVKAWQQACANAEKARNTQSKYRGYKGLVG